MHCKLYVLKYKLCTGAVYKVQTLEIIAAFNNGLPHKRKQICRLCCRRRRHFEALRLHIAIEFGVTNVKIVAR